MANRQKAAMMWSGLRDEIPGIGMLWLVLPGASTMDIVVGRSERKHAEYSDRHRIVLEHVPFCMALYCTMPRMI